VRRPDKGPHLHLQGAVALAHGLETRRTEAEAPEGWTRPRDTSGFMSFFLAQGART
jgi:hypothetical protein